MLENGESSNGVIWFIAGAFVMVFSVIIALCAGFKKKHKNAFSLEPVRLIFKHENVRYAEPDAVRNQNQLRSLDTTDGHLRPHSPNWRNSSLSRELPAIPNVPLGSPGADGGVTGSSSLDGIVQSPLQRYESGSNLYACLDEFDRSREAPVASADPQSSDSSRETDFPNRNGRIVVHPYDRIGGPVPNAPFYPVPAHAPTSASGLASTQNHAQILQQMDNEVSMADYRGEARSDMSYTSITVRAPLSNLRPRRMSEDGYANVPGDNHLYAQVGGEYGGSMVSDQLGSHIYDDLYAEIDAHLHPPLSPPSSLIDPYATSMAIPSSSSDPEYSNIPSTSSGTTVQQRQDEVDKLYAKINKPERGRNPSFAENQQPVSNRPVQRSNLVRNRPVSRDLSGGGEPSTSQAFVGTSSTTGTLVIPVANGRSVSDIRASCNAAINSMDNYLSEFLTDADGASSSRGHARRGEHVYEQLPDL